MPLLYEQLSFGISNLEGAQTKLIAIRVQDVTKHKWYNWDNGVWDQNGEPKCTPGGNLYVAAYAVNEGEQGVAGISIGYAGYVQQQTGNLAPGQGIGFEANYAMPLKGNILLSIADSIKTTNITVRSTVSESEETIIPWNIVIATGAVVGISVVAAALLKSKGVL